MSTKKLILLAMLGGSLIGLYYAGAPAAESQAADPGLRSTVAAVPGRVAHGLGVVGARMVGGVVRKMVYETEQELELLRRDLRTVQGTYTQMTNAREGVRRIQVMDSTALASLEVGRPVQAFKLAMQANGLVGPMHENLRGE